MLRLFSFYKIIKGPFRFADTYQTRGVCYPKSCSAEGWISNGANKVVSLLHWKKHLTELIFNFLSQFLQLIILSISKSLHSCRLNLKTSCHVEDKFEFWIEFHQEILILRSNPQLDINGNKTYPVPLEFVGPEGQGYDRSAITLRMQVKSYKETCLLSKVLPLINLM